MPCVVPPHVITQVARQDGCTASLALKPSRISDT